MMLRQRDDRAGNRELATGKRVQGETCGCGCVTSTLLKTIMGTGLEPVMTAFGE